MRYISQSSWLLFLVISLLVSLVTGLVLIWLSIERTDMAFTIKQMHGQLEERIALRAKLEVERDRLLAPYILRPKAVKLGMHEAQPGQIRKLIDPKDQAN